MKTTELMIGDWVKPKNIDTYFRVGLIGLDSVWTDTDTYEWDYDEIEPIPLTPEILEKNGFTKRKDGQWAIEKKRIVGCCGQTCDNTNPLVYAIWVDKGYMGVVNYHPEATITKVGSYVHELQQCIRISGIDKEIML